MIGQLLKVGYEIVAVGFIVLVILTVRKARARGKRLFADEPTARIKALSADTRRDHSQDAT
jgi:uncharacterized protein YoxC